MSFKALEGMVVLDLGIITAGASTSTILADLGAEVIKIEGPRYVDPFRYWSNEPGAGKWWEESPPFILTNRGKRSVCIDLKSEDGRALFLDMVRKADVVVENFRVGVLNALGISYETLRAVNEKIILISISSQGQAGPDAKAVSFGSTLEGSSGMASLIHYPNSAPQISGHALNYPDQVVSLFAAGAVICALVDRRDVAHGSHLDLSQRELASFMLGDYLMAALDGGLALPPRTSTIQTVAATGDLKWVAAHFPTVDSAERFADRAEDGDGLLSLINEVILHLSAEEAVRRIREVGGQGVLVRTSADLLAEGSHGRHSDALAHDVEGNSVKGLPWRFGSKSLPPPTAITPLGFDNEEIIVKWLGRRESEYRRLVAQGIVATEPEM